MTTAVEPYVPEPGDHVEIWDFGTFTGYTGTVDSPTEHGYWIVTEDGTGCGYAVPASFLVRIEHEGKS
jgi:hypothetical protein